MLMRLSLFSLCFVVAAASPSFAGPCIKTPMQLTGSAEVPASVASYVSSVVSVQIPAQPFEIEQVSVTTSTATEPPDFLYTGLAAIQLVTRVQGQSATHPLASEPGNYYAPTTVLDSGFTKRVTLYGDASSTVELRFKAAGANAIQVTVTLSGKLVSPSCWTSQQ